MPVTIQFIENAHYTSMATKAWLSFSKDTIQKESVHGEPIADIDSWLVDALYLNGKFKMVFDTYAILRMKLLCFWLV